MAAAKRNEGEKFSDYKERLKSLALAEKQIMKGKLFWDSSRRGTYIKGGQN